MYKVIFTILLLDSLLMNTVSVTTKTTTKVLPNNGPNSGLANIPLLKKLRNPSELQLKLERQLQKSRAVKACFKKLTPRNVYATAKEKASLLNDTSEDDFEDINLKVNEDDEKVMFLQPGKNAALSDCHDHLLTDGYNLDEMSDDEDLDLIPPKPPPSLWCACQATSCTIS